MIIVEGPDGSGKSTLIERLGYARIHLKSLSGGVGGKNIEGWLKPGERVFDAYRRQIEEAMAIENRGGTRVAFDRFHMSEHVYGPILRHKQLVPDDLMNEIGSMLMDLRIPLILALPPFKTTLANVNLDGRERPAYQTEGFLHRAYTGFQKAQPWAQIIFDYTKDALPVVKSSAD